MIASVCFSSVVDDILQIANTCHIGIGYWACLLVIAFSNV